MEPEREYVVSYGLLGDVGRFRPANALNCRRGDLAVVHSHRGVEVGQVLCPATPRHARFLPDALAGTLLRLATPEDERATEQARRRGQEVFDEARRTAETLDLPLEVIDTEVLLDNDHVVLHFVRWAEGDLRDLVSALSTHFSMHVLLQDLTKAGAAHEEHGCGDCGAGGCGSGGCGTGGCGSCSSGAKADDVRAYFAELREKMLSRTRTTLL
jgi:cell fate regulator YaaT (PSP1 superfamily)